MLLFPQRDCWSETEYADILSDAEKRLWLFAQENASWHSPKNTVAQLAQISAGDLRFLQRLYFLFSPSVQAALHESIPRLLRRLTQSTGSITAEINGGIRGRVDWNQTVKRRLAAGLGSPSLFVVSQPIKTFDTPEVGATKWLLVQVRQLCVQALGAVPTEDEPKSYETNVKWRSILGDLYHLAESLLSHVCIRNVALPTQITDTLLQRIRCARGSGFQEVYQSLRLYRKLFLQEDQETLEACIAQGVLKPLNRDTLYELYILLLTLAALESAGWESEKLALVGQNKGAIARYKNKTATVSVYYQTLPKAFARQSLYTDLLRKHSIDFGLRRPDLLLEFRGRESHFVLLEVKRTRDKQYIVDSIYKVLGYLKDFEKHFDAQHQPNAMLVVWEGVNGGENVEASLVVLNRNNYQQFLESKILRHNEARKPGV